MCGAQGAYNRVSGPWPNLPMPGGHGGRPEVGFSDAGEMIRARRGRSGVPAFEKTVPNSVMRLPAKGTDVLADNTSPVEEGSTRVAAQEDGSGDFLLGQGVPFYPVC